MADIPPFDGAVDEVTLAQWRAEFEAAAKRPLEERWKYAFIKTYKPVMDDERFRCWGHDR